MPAMAPSLANQAMYQIFARNFGTSPDGPGTFRHIREKLHAIRMQGFEVIWVMGIFKLGDRTIGGTMGSPYAIADYCAVDPRLGTINDFRLLVEEAHYYGLKVIIDAVFNHTSKDHFWIQQHPQWYLPPVPKTRIAEDSWQSYQMLWQPSGYSRLQQSRFPGVIHDDPFQDQIVSEGHDDVGYWWTDTAQLNLAHPLLRAELIRILKFWVDLGVDGFRCDMAMLLLNRVLEQQWGAYGAHIILPDTEFWTEAIQAVKHHAKQVRGAATSIYFIAEAYRYLDELAQCGFSAIYHHDLYNAVKNAVKYHAPAAALRTALSTIAWPPGLHSPQWVTYLMNHDEEAACLEFGSHYGISLLLMLMVPALFMVYNGEEYGNLNSRQIQYVTYLMANREHPQQIPFFAVKDREVRLDMLYRQFLQLKKETLRYTTRCAVLAQDYGDSPLIGLCLEAIPPVGEPQYFALFFNFSSRIQSADKDWDTFTFPDWAVQHQPVAVIDRWQAMNGVQEVYPFAPRLIVGLLPGDFHFFLLQSEG